MMRFHVSFLLLSVAGKMSSASIIQLQGECKSWCNPYTCGLSACTDCSTCGEVRGGTYCAGWCNAYTMGFEVCAGCHASCEDRDPESCPLTGFDCYLSNSFSSCPRTCHSCSELVSQSTPVNSTAYCITDYRAGDQDVYIPGDDPEEVFKLCVEALGKAGPVTLSYAAAPRFRICPFTGGFDVNATGSDCSECNLCTDEIVPPGGWCTRGCKLLEISNTGTVYEVWSRKEQKPTLEKEKIFCNLRPYFGFTCKAERPGVAFGSFYCLNRADTVMVGSPGSPSTLKEDCWQTDFTTKPGFYFTHGQCLETPWTLPLPRGGGINISDVQGLTLAYYNWAFPNLDVGFIIDVEDPGHALRDFTVNPNTIVSPVVKQMATCLEDGSTRVDIWQDPTADCTDGAPTMSYLTDGVLAYDRNSERLCTDAGVLLVE